jgi:hypothetical protein
LSSKSRASNVWQFISHQKFPDEYISSKVLKGFAKELRIIDNTVSYNFQNKLDFIFANRAILLQQFD